MVRRNQVVSFEFLTQVCQKACISLGNACVQRQPGVMSQYEWGLAVFWRCLLVSVVKVARCGLPHDPYPSQCRSLYSAWGKPFARWVDVQDHNTSCRDIKHQIGPHARGSFAAKHKNLVPGLVHALCLCEGAQHLSRSPTGAHSTHIKTIKQWSKRMVKTVLHRPILCKPGIKDALRFLPFASLAQVFMSVTKTVLQAKRSNPSFTLAAGDPSVRGLTRRCRGWTKNRCRHPCS